MKDSEKRKNISRYSRASVIHSLRNVDRNRSITKGTRIPPDAAKVKDILIKRTINELPLSIVLWVYALLTIGDISLLE